MDIPVPPSSNLQTLSPAAIQALAELGISDPTLVIALSNDGSIKALRSPKVTDEVVQFPEKATAITGFNTIGIMNYEGSKCMLVQILGMNRKLCWK